MSPLGSIYDVTAGRPIDKRGHKNWPRGETVCPWCVSCQPANKGVRFAQVISLLKGVTRAARMRHFLTPCGASTIESIGSIGCARLFPPPCRGTLTSRPQILILTGSALLLTNPIIELTFVAIGFGYWRG